MGSGAEIDTDGLLGGGQLGYLHQISNIVFGIDVSGSASNVNETIASPTVAGDTWDAGLNVLFLAQARLGWTQDQWLVFVQGGYAGAEADATGTAPGGPVGAATLWHDGWTVGGGVMLQLDDGISIGAEYNYVDLEEERYNVVAAPPTDLVDVDHEIHIFKFTGTIHLGRLFGGP